MLICKKTDESLTVNKSAKLNLAGNGNTNNIYEPENAENQEILFGLDNEEIR